MNLYLVLAIALGAITGIVEAPVLRPVHFVTASERRRERRVLPARKSHVRLASRSGWAGLTPEAWGLTPFAIAAPRAPASV